ncbi:iron compound ABC transporter permease [Enterococcus haemoperoxidus ATCC BAA-382]|uniref:Iron compound ABC transporter permease n=1 Tax=Enterococcus haemoperoxidus ATCC BAA-382 TaxID=1158608 RepID=R2TA95_9ENTE|nr:iron chelate uptake ABC transporter family permease subunit [Enterococcus haemoperoxidus]EOH97159.1 iron compound ABC transporter permease [Enterococcus haemoperoxidus ATCC BAA-382]EOT59972.1 iron compound ABC transporter permease [Enterococcus haemoperoxidus ATCC BAA-382]OJG56153.1 iron compound ABC transporter permease [Enterococcus haemoperoxidus]
MKKIGLFVLLLLLIVSSIFVGVKDISLTQLFQWDSQQQLVLLTTRLPRTISLVIAGSTISISGLIMQHLTQNKFVSPSTAGTMDSARLGILVVMILFPSAPLLFRSFIAFLFAFGGTLIFIYLTRFLPAKNQVMIPLIGVMFGNIIGSVATFFAYQFQLVQNMSSWLQGNFSTVMKGNYELLYLTIPLLIITYLFAYRFTVVGMGEDMATNLGLNYQRIQLFGLGIVALSSAVVLIMVGNIPFLGVIVPNLVSMRYGDHMKNTLAITAVGGSIFLLACDVLARVVIAPYEVPVSVVVGVLGSFIFIALLMRRKTA